MEEERQDTAINLTTSKEALSNGDVMQNGENGDSSQGHGVQTSQSFAGKASTPITGAAKRKVRQNSSSSAALGDTAAMAASVQQPIMMMAAQHGLTPQQVQQLVQQQSLSPQQLQQMMQQQSIMLQHQQQQKLQEQVLQQLNEQLQMNILQQSQLMQQQQDKSKSSHKQAQQQLQQLGLQQQQLVQQIQQIQIQQRQYLLACLVQPFGVPQGMMTPGEIQQLWKEVASHSGLDESVKMNVNGLTTGASIVPPHALGMPQSATCGMGSNGLPDGYLIPGGLLPGHSPISVKTEAQDNSTSPNPSSLYRHGLCKWPGCDTPCDDINAFSKHLSLEHVLDDRSTAQARVQMQVVSQLEIQLSREKEMLQAMMQHLHHQKQESILERTSPPVSSVSVAMATQSPVVSTPVTPLTPIKYNTVSTAPSPQSPPTILSASTCTPLIIPPPHISSTVSQPSTPCTPGSQSQPSSQPSTPTSAGPIRRRVSDKCNLPISTEIQRNREFYKNTDVRPPFTYASLIRQAIIESPHKQLTLNEIYQWFQNTFAYFRRNEATWKNAVRHNLSLHKCFMRVENVKGAVWTVDEVEFYKRRPQKMSGNISMKSPSLSGDPSVYGENLNASLRAALEQSNMSLLNHQMSNGVSLSIDGAEDLSMRSRNSSNDSFDQSPSREDMIRIKQESIDSDQLAAEDQLFLKQRQDLIGNKQQSLNSDHLTSEEQLIVKQHQEAEEISNANPEDLMMAKDIMLAMRREIQQQFNNGELNLALRHDTQIDQDSVVEKSNVVSQYEDHHIAMGDSDQSEAMDMSSAATSPTKAEDVMPQSPPQLPANQDFFTSSLQSGDTLALTHSTAS